MKSFDSSSTDKEVKCEYFKHKYNVNCKSQTDKYPGLFYYFFVLENNFGIYSNFFFTFVFIFKKKLNIKKFYYFIVKNRIIYKY